jgi:hypothetical protein
MKFSLISLITLALTSTSVMAKPSRGLLARATMTPTPLAFAVEKRALDNVQGTILKDVQGHKNPQSNAASGSFYKKEDFVTITCYTDTGTSSVEGNL